MNMLKQTAAALRITLDSLPSRLWSSLNTVLGTAVVVAVMVAILSIGAGYTETMRLSSAKDGWMILQAGTSSEMESSIPAQEALLIEAARQQAGATAAESYAVVALTGAKGQPVNVALRGATESSAGLRGDVQIVEGRDFTPGRREIVAGQRAQKQFGGLAIGQVVRIAGADWTVVGSFTDGGRITESEMWADRGMVQAALNRADTVQVIQSARAPGETAETVANALNADGRLNVNVVSRKEYYASQAQSMQRFVTILGAIIVALMSLGAVFAALNTGYSHVKARAKELATLSVLGWTGGALTAAITIEALILNLLGAAIGAGISYLLFDDRLVSTLFFASDFTQVVFTFAVTARIVLLAMALALFIGLAGSLGPAMQMRRLPIARLLLRRN